MPRHTACRTLAALAALVAATPARALESTSSLTFGERDYAFRQELRDLPPCPGLLDVLFSLDTMRRLMRGYDSLVVLREEPDAQVVRVTYDVFGLDTTLDYDRHLDRAGGGIELRLLSYAADVSFLPLPTTFVARYRLATDADGTLVDYTQEASLPSRVSWSHQLLVERQMARFERRLRGVVAEACP
jgi:hypothetical protein